MIPMKIAIIVGKMDSGGKKNLIMEYYRHIDRNIVQFDFICDSDSQTSVYKGYKQDKIEMRGDRAEMSDFPLYFRNSRPGHKADGVAEMPMKRYKSAARCLCPTRREPRANMRDLNIFYQE